MITLEEETFLMRVMYGKWNLIRTVARRRWSLVVIDIYGRWSLIRMAISGRWCLVILTTYRRRGLVGKTKVPDMD